MRAADVRWVIKPALEATPQRASKSGERTWYAVGRSGPDQTTAAGASRVIGEVQLSDEALRVGILRSATPGRRRQHGFIA
jgi:hypothetical protein